MEKSVKIDSGTIKNIEHYRTLLINSVKDYYTRDFIKKMSISDVIDDAVIRASNIIKDKKFVYKAKEDEKRDE